MILSPTQVQYVIDAHSVCYGKADFCITGVSRYFSSLMFTAFEFQDVVQMKNLTAFVLSN
jgi:hypothetical protein